MKKLVSILLALITWVSVLSITASAEGFTYEFDNHSEALYMIRMDTGHPVYALNADERRPVASMTKIMSYIVAYESIPDIEKVTITVDDSIATILEGTGSSLSGILIGEKLTGLQLLNMMMVPSGNDAALALSQYVDGMKEETKEAGGNTEPSGSQGADAPEKSDAPESTASVEGEDIFEGGAVSGTSGGGSAAQDSPAAGDEPEASDDPALNMPDSRFIRLMNEKAQELGCEDTHFTNPHGLHHENHYSTARDMAVIARYATTLPYFAEITSSPSYTLAKTNKYDQERTVHSTNYMFSQFQDEGKYYYPYAKGIKTGSINESGYCIAASAVLEGDSYIVIAMGSKYVDEKGERVATNGAMLDAKALFKWAFTSLEMKTVAMKGDLLGDVQLQYAWDKDRLQLVAGENIQAVLPKDVSISSIVVTVDTPDKVQAPVKKGDLLGKAKFAYADETIATIDVVAAESVERSEIVQTLEVGREVISSPVFLVIAGIVVLILLVYFASIIVYNHKKKRMRKVKKYRDL